MSDLSHDLGFDNHPQFRDALNSFGKTMFLSAAQGALDHNNLPINLAQFVPTVSAGSGAAATTTSAQNTLEDQAQRVNGIKVVLHALIEGVSIDSKTAQQFITDVETKLDAWVDSIG